MADKRPDADQAHALLKDYRQALQPPTGSAERSLAAVKEQLAGSPPPSKAPGASGAGVKLATGVGVLAVVVAAVWLGAGPEHANHQPEHTSPGDGLQEPVAARALSEPDPRPPVPVPALRAEAAPGQAEVQQQDSLSAQRQAQRTPLPQVPASSKVHSTEVDAPSAAEPESALEKELRLLRRGQAALSAGDANQALQWFERHAREFPSGVLAGERQLKRAESLCKLGRVSQARVITEGIIERRPESAAAQRARRICP